MTEILFECCYCEATSVSSALVHSHLTYILRSSTTTSNLVRIFSYAHFCQETKTIKLTVIFTTSCLVNSILKHTGFIIKAACNQPFLSIFLFSALTEWNLLTTSVEMGWQDWVDAILLHWAQPLTRRGAVADTPLNSNVQPWPSSNIDHMSQADR